MSNVVVTELVVDARGAVQGTADYTRAMNAAQAAVDRMLDRDEKLRVSQEKVAAVMTGGAGSVAALAKRIDGLQRSIDPAFAATKRLQDIQVTLDAGVRRGIRTQEDANRLLDQYRQKLDPAIASTRAAAAAFEQLARQDFGNIAKVNDYLSRIGREAGELTRAMNPLLVAQEKYNASLDQANRLARQSLISEETRRTAIEASRRALEAAGSPSGPTTNLQRSLDYVSTVRQSGGSARDSASVFEAEAKAMEAMTAQAARLRAELNPLATAYDKMTVEIERYQDAASRQGITQDDLVLLTQKSRDEFDKTAASLRPVGEVARLSAGQVQNLGYQINDAATMLLSGSSPFQVIATQGGQVLQILQENGGVIASLRAMGEAALEAAVKGTTGLTAMAAAGAAATTSVSVSGIVAGIGSLVSKINPAVAAIGALATASAYLWYTGRDAAGDAQKAVESYGKAVSAVRDSYGDLGDAIEDALQKQLRGSASLASAQVAGSINIQRAALRSGVESLNDVEGFGVSTSTIGGIKTLLNSFDPAIDSMRDLYAELMRGDQTVAEFQESIAKIRLDPAISTDAKKIADQLLEMSQGARAAEASIAALNRAALELKNARFADFSKQLDDFVPNQKLVVDVINDTADAALQQAVSIGQVYEIERKRKAGLDEISRVETVRRAGYELDIRAISARTAAQRADIDADRMRLSLAGETISSDEKTRRVEEARTLSLTQSQHDLTEASRQRIEAGQSQVDQTNLDLTLIGKSAAETAHLRTEYDLMTAAKKAAVDAGSLVGQDEIDAIKRQADAIGDATAAMEKLNIQRDLQFRVDQAGRSPAEQKMAEEVRSYGEDIKTANGEGLAAQLRYVASVEKTAAELQNVREIGKDAFLDIVDALGSGENAVDGLIGAFANLGKQLASLGAKKLFDGLFGDQADAASNGIAGIGKAAQTVANQNTAPADYTRYSAPLGKVERSILPALTNTTQKFASNSDDLATNIQLAASTLGTSAKDLATVIGYETGGTFSTSIRGGANNQHIGLIQFGPAEQKRYGAAIGQTLSTQMDAVVGYLKDRGFKPGMGLLDLYSTINAGSPGRYSASDAGNGGAPGSVYDKVTTQMAGHMARADSILAGTKRDFEKVVENGSSRGVEKGLNNFDLGPYDSGTPSNPNGGQAGSGGGFLTSALGKNIFAGVGSFANGMQGGSPVSGALSGALGGFMAGGPIGALIGGAAGLLGGIFGKNKQKKQEEAEAKRQWEGMQPQYEAYRKYLSGEESGDLRTDFQNIQAQFNQFQGASVKAKNGDLADTAQTFYKYVQRQLGEFREALEGVSTDLADGAGLDGPFAKGKSSIRQLQKQLLGYLDDVAIAYYQADNGLTVGAPLLAAEKEWAEKREAALATARRAAQEQAISVINPDAPLSNVEENFRSLQGAAQQLVPTLVKLGMEAVEAARRVGGELNEAIAKMATAFVEGYQRSINEFQGVGYFNDVADLLKDLQSGLSDAALLGVDTAIVNTEFKLAAQDIVDGSELTGTAFDDLIAKFPELSGVVTAFVDETAVAVRTASEIAEAARAAAVSSFDAASSQLRSAYDTASGRLESLSDGIRDFLRDIRLDDTASPLSGKDQFLEAQRMFQDTQAKAVAGDTAAQDDLLGVSQDYLDEAKAYYGSSEAYYAAFNEVENVLKATDVKATSQLDLMKQQVGKLIDISDATVDIAAAIKDFLGAREMVNTTRNWGPDPTKTKGVDADLRSAGLNYTGDYVNGAFANWARSQLPSTQQIIEVILRRYNDSLGLKMQMGGIVPGFADGGLIGNGIWNVDSVLARYAGGGHIGLAGGEFVMPADVTRQNLGMLETMRAGRMPEAYAMPAMPRLQVPGNDNSAVVQAIGRLASIMESFVTVVAGSGQGTAKEIAGLSVEMRSVGRELKKAAGAPR